MKYIITDPCYIIPNDQWHKFLEETDFMNGNTPFPCEPTWYGDGTYLVIKDGRLVGSFGVDSGTFCVAPIDQIKNLSHDLKNLG